MKNQKKTVSLVLVGVLVAILALIAVIIIPILTHENSGASGQTKPDGFVSEVTATGEDGKTRTLSAQTIAGDPADLSRVTPGDTVIIHGEGFDASIGIYVSVCRIPEDVAEKPSPCLGGIPEDATEEHDETAEMIAQESVWITNNWAWRTFATDQYLDADVGTFEAKLLIPPSATELLDCSEAACGIFTRADHTAGNERVQDLYLPVAYAEN